jgi:hypothetical protein
MPSTSRARAGGRPPKFDEPRRPVTMTLPERTLRHLAAFDNDRASAIVKLVDSHTSAATADPSLVEVVEVAPGAAVILVPASRALRRIPWLRLAEVAPGRHLLTIVSGMAVESLEVAILDLIESLPEEDDTERRILEELRSLIGSGRRKQTIRKFEMLYVPPARKRSLGGASRAADPARAARTG